MSKINLFIRVSLCLLLVLSSIWTNTIRMSICAEEDVTENSDSDSSEDDILTKKVIDFYLYHITSNLFNTNTLHTEQVYTNFSLFAEVAEHQFCQSVDIEPPCCNTLI